jgi:hypothetical protein
LNPRKTHDLSVFLSKKTVHATFADRFCCNMQAISLEISHQVSEWSYVLYWNRLTMCVSLYNQHIIIV